jgi:hypothetical protein
MVMVEVVTRSVQDEVSKSRIWNGRSNTFLTYYHSVEHGRFPVIPWGSAVVQGVPGRTCSRNVLNTRQPIDSAIVRSFWISLNVKASAEQSITA